MQYKSTNANPFDDAYLWWLSVDTKKMSSKARKQLRDFTIGYLYHVGYSTGKIAALMECSPVTVRKILTEGGETLEYRGRGKHFKLNQ